MRGFAHIKGAIGMSLLIAAGLAAASNSSFGALTYTGSGTAGRAASVTFDVVGGDLVVSLSNTGTEPTTQWDATYLLGGVFFNYTGPGTLAANGTASGAVLSAGNGVIGTLASGTTIGSYWAYGSGLTGGPNGAQQALTGVGYGLGNLPANGNMGPNGQTVDGVAGSLLGWNNVNNANASVTGHEPIAYTTIEFTLTGSALPNTLVASDFTDVTFQYGTALSSPSFLGNLVGLVPEPNYGITAGILMISLVGGGFIKQFRVA